MAATRRITAGVTVAAACAVALAGCGEQPREERPVPPKKAAPAPAPKNAVRLIGDGSTAFTGSQPRLARPERLRPGQKPPQFVVFSWDGAGEDSQKLFSHFRKVAKANKATMTYFLSGVYMLPEEERNLYHAPQHSSGRSDIGFNDRTGIANTVAQLRGAWLEGNEIGTHFNGHFCGKDGGVGQWSVDEWKSEIRQAKSFVKAWKSHTGLKGEAPLPFDYEKELIGGRTPCLEGQKNFIEAGRDMGFRYDTSGVNDQVWPKKKQGLWDLSMQLVPVPGRSFETLTMDYNFMVNQSGTATQGDPDKHAYWGDQMRDGLLQGFERAYRGNRAPLVIGNHFESWNGGAYMRAVEQTIERVCTRSEVRCVSFRQLADWLDAQDPKLLARLSGLGVGKAPKEGWASFLSARPAPAPKGVPGAPAVKPAER
ncbi:hypothetical protein [Streptomyces tsukubensis]|uniref:Lipoprotein n=1 Tax=Streptomyces tsukubensis TaxID=83656 RepID=A0A1V4AB27_9ACTN|nr:hypothetical protein [Streptomyces tsukubensis]OON81038.1 hypothetical protein B1H18_09470 [Streptomyces tsukubensis]QFR94877.1 hypothetical protein GBW32_19845 [Streptomyces tsukubensis]